jgi:hypothetical protein
MVAGVEAAAEAAPPERQLALAKLKARPLGWVTERKTVWAKGFAPQSKVKRRPRLAPTAMRTAVFEQRLGWRT